MKMLQIAFVGLVLVVALRQAEASEGAIELRVMTFNLRYASTVSLNRWEVRRPVMARLLHKEAPDLIGTQEGLYEQLKDLRKDLADYDWIGLGRDGGSRGEFMAIFYRRDRFEPLAFDHFWLSDTPEVVGSSTWGNKNRRMVTWVKFRERQSGLEFYLFNTHFDHRVEEAREKSAALLLARIDRLETPQPVIVTGDFNAAAPESKVYTLLVHPRGLRDSWSEAKERSPSLGTFHNYGGPKEGEPRIDWILYRGPIDCLSTRVVTFSEDRQYPSDHFPVVSVLRVSRP